jgi:hypothetical protein
MPAKLPAIVITKPPVKQPVPSVQPPTSLKSVVQGFVLGLPGCEWLDSTLAHNPDGQRGDYWFPADGVIVEQKEIMADRRRQTETATRQIFEILKKYGLDETQVAAIDSDQIMRITDGDRRRISNHLARAVNFIEADLKWANGQIADTKDHLRRQDAGGMVLFINELAGYFMPEHMTMRINELLHRKKDDGTPRFDHINGVLLFQKMQGFTYSGRSGGTWFTPNYLLRHQFVERFAEMILREWQKIHGGELLRVDIERPLVNVIVQFHPVAWIAPIRHRFTIIPPPRYR